MPQRDWVRTKNLFHCQHRRRCLKRRTTREQAIQRCSECINIGADANAAGVLELFGGHVRRRADGVAGIRHPRIVVGQLRQSKVGKQSSTGRTLQQNILRLEISMQDSVAMHGIDGTTDRFQPFGRLPIVGRTLASLLRETATLDVPHREVMTVRLTTDFVDRDQIVVSDSCGGLGFRTKAFDDFSLGRRVHAGEPIGTDDLQRDKPIHADLLGSIDDPHAAASEFLLQFVIAELLRNVEPLAAWTWHSRVCSCSTRRFDKRFLLGNRRRG